MKTNPLLPVLGFAVVLIAGWALFRDSGDAPTQVPPQGAAPMEQPANLDADTLDALKTVAARLKKADEENDALKQRLATLEAHVQEQSSPPVVVETTTTPPRSSTPIGPPRLPDLPPGVVTGSSMPVTGSDSDDLVDQVINQPLSFGKPFARLSTQPVDPLASALNGIPVGGANADLPGGTYSVSSQPGYVRIMPLKAGPTPDGYQPSIGADGDSLATSQTALVRAKATASQLAAQALGPEIQPRYTIPANATFLDSVTMTALIGRVPVNGDVTDPVPFKVLVGASNLAANGYSIPGLHGMVMSGRATGDRTFSCVYGHVDSVTYVFEDGRIVTHPDSAIASAGAGRLNPGSSQSLTDGLAWLSDPHGNPCVPGKYVSNRAESTALSVLLGAATAGANAFAEAQTTTRDTASGSSTSVDNPNDFLLGRMAAGGANEVAQSLSRHLPDDWDAVYLPAGSPVAVHITRTLPIDLVPDARRVAYSPTGTKHGGLD
ncbi:MAG: TIGR03752 family integrating conjugative element protein [Gammaproteobacteria bacterium]|nr:TIGR03752 family integrating conjugative element protein [Gammaproteobacteria bacterium]